MVSDIHAAGPCFLHPLTFAFPQSFDDKQVPLIVHSPSFTGAVQNTEYVSTRQIQIGKSVV